MSTIMDIWRIGNEVKEMVYRMPRSNAYERVRLANLLEHIGYVMKETCSDLAEGRIPTSGEHAELLSEELYFKLAVLAREEHARIASQSFLRLQRLEILRTLITDEGVDLAQLHLLEETANNFIDTSKALRMY
ncbi:MAG: hypothetical protein KIT62_03585 [Cyclobacteriaceae bacterium]|nr:hypothetical protein [Cyclobacteriaceae bacterium]